MKSQKTKHSLLTLASIVFLIGCTSLSGTSQNPNACQVWTDDLSQTDKVTVENDAAFFGLGCITGRYGCKWKEAKFEGDDIVVDGALASRTGKIATYKDGVLKQNFEGLTTKIVAGAAIDKASFEFKKDRVVYIVHYAGVAKSIARKNSHVINYFHSSQCSQKEAALGVGFFLAGRK